MGDICHECGNEYQKIAQHWSASNCTYQQFSDYQHDVLTGLLMGDGWLSTCNKRPRISVELITKDYLTYLANEVFPVCSGGVNLKRTAKEAAEVSRKAGFRPNAKAENYSDIYSWQTTSHPELEQYREWYSTGEKCFPEDIELTPTMLKTWYVCDGFVHNDRYPGIALSNEHGARDKIDNMFREQGLTDYYWKVSKTDDKHATKPNATVRFRTAGADNFFRYVGSPPPGFEYKFP